MDTKQTEQFKFISALFSNFKNGGAPSADIGSGTGQFANALGIEYKFDIKPYDDSIRYLDLLSPFTERYSFWNVTMCHVLEHIHDPITALNNVYNNFLRPTGRLFIIVPHGGFPNSNHTPFDYTHLGHVMPFTPQHLNSCVKASGFTTLYISENFTPGWEEIAIVAEKPGQA